MRVHYLKHESFEDLGNMEPWFRAQDAMLRPVEVYRGEPLPLLGDFDWLVIMGGGMSVNDEDRYPWLRPEKVLVREAVEAGKHVVGVCLGAQMIANALGARVYRNAHREIGWWPIEREAGASAHALARALPARAEVYHWHGETFDLPPDAVRLARSAVCANQAFVAGPRVLGLQCHLETTRESVEALVHGLPGDMVPGPYVQTLEAMLERPERFEALRSLMWGILEVLKVS